MEPRGKGVLPPGSSLSLVARSLAPQGTNGRSRERTVLLGTAPTPAANTTRTARARRTFAVEDLLVEVLDSLP
jgi:hypothetical protein